MKKQMCVTLPRYKTEKAKANWRKWSYRNWAPGEFAKAEAKRKFVSSCACCGTDTPGGRHGWQADHNHITGLFRDFVCFRCNVTIGHLEKKGKVCQAYLDRFA